MISWTTKTLFEGYLPCPNYIVKRCLRVHEDLHCFYGDQEMIIKELDLIPKIQKESELYDDKHNMNGGKQYKLLYYVWNPLTKEQLNRKYCGY